MPRRGAIRQRAQLARSAAEERLERTRERRGIREVLLSLRAEQTSGADLLSGGLAYRFFLWLVPFGLVVAAVASFWVRLSPTGVRDAARSFGLGGVAATSATHAVEDGSRARWYLLAAGILLSVRSGMGAVRALRVAARLAWSVEADRLRHPLRASTVFTAMCVIGLSASMAASWARHSHAALGLAVTVADVVVYTLLALLAFDHLPHPDGISWREQWPGALLAGAGITGVQLFLAYYLAGKLERSPALYGTLGAATVVLLVLFLIARLVVSAMFLNATLQRLRVDSRD